MTSDDTVPEWPTRVLRVASLLLLGGALLAWLAPLSVPSKNLQPFGCGSPSSPMKGDLAKLICNDDITEARYIAFALLISAAALLVMSELVAPRFASRPAFRGFAGTATLALPIMAVSAMMLVSPVGGEGSDGSLIRCGTALKPVKDPFVRGLCGHLPERQKVLAFGGVALSLMFLAAGTYVTAGKVTPGGDDDTDGGDDTDGDDGPGPEGPLDGDASDVVTETGLSLR